MYYILLENVFTGKIEAVTVSAPSSIAAIAKARLQLGGTWIVITCMKEQVNA